MEQFDNLTTDKNEMKYEMKMKIWNYDMFIIERSLY